MKTAPKLHPTNLNVLTSHIRFHFIFKWR